MKGMSPMQITLTWQGIITAGAVLAAVIAIVAYFAKAVRWVDKQNEQEEKIKALQEEQALLVHGVLACLKGLKEQGCNGPVTAAIDQFEDYLNKKAHE
jgi:hypothetical protein